MECLIDGLRINYTSAGEGKPLLILHGWGSKKERWQTVAKLLSSRGFQVIIPDLPGFGESNIPNNTWDTDDYANFVDGFIKHLEIKDFYLLGHSFGGNIAVKYAIKNARIKKLFLVGAACIRSKTTKINMLYIVSRIFKFLGVIPFVKRIFYRIIKSDYHYTSGLMRKIYLKVLKEDLSEVLNKVKVPTLIIWGDKDKVTPLNLGKEIQSKIDGSGIEIIPNMGHNLHSECPGLLADIIAKQ